MQYSSIDFENKSFTIKHTVTAVTIDHERKLIKRDGTKTESSGRTLPLDDVFANMLLAKKAKQAGLEEIRFHDLRHTAASILLKNGASMKQIQEWLGHSDYGTTANIYSHLDDSSKKAVGTLISNVYTSKQEALQEK